MADRTAGTQSPDNPGHSVFRRLTGLPAGSFWREVREICRLAGPVFLSHLMVFTISTVSTIFCGHLGKTELGAASLATSIVCVSGISVGVGLSLACDTLISQTYGSKNLTQIGVILQRAILILMIFCLPCWAIFINTELILLAFKQPPQVAKLAQLYVKIFIPALPMTFLYELESRYLQNQGIILPQIFTGFVTNIFNAVINYVLLYVLATGVAGSAAANVASQYCQAIVLFVYIQWKKLHVQTWAGWSTECLQEWGQFMLLAVPSLFMVCIEWWTFEIGIILAGLVNEVELGAQTIIYQGLSAAYMIPLGYSVAASVRVGKALGAQKTEEAKTSARVALWCAGVSALVISSIMAAMKNVVGYIFTTDKDIIQLVAELHLLIAAFHFFDAMSCVRGGILIGTGKQKLGAIASLIAFYLIGYPIGISLMFAAKLGVLGLWSGLFISVTLQAIFFQIVISKLNWNKATYQALINAGVTSGMNSPSITSSRHTEENVEEMESHAEAGQLIEDSCEPQATVVVGDLLSLKQLILRRSLALISGLIVLTIGLVIHFTVGTGT
ncbi:multidrug and toxin extrusion protein 1-like isoform X1 [Pristis pectinata]|uniref:multidrug and toxin extrusion protein 1-like isoform X1 n=1 Tax=Pristis pectinata TaxID=685728 RepID=UPI00223E78A5|nr:multidrug and toxin extrusion protein 1-like isoform X1 [Pristis pectinata]